MQCDFIKLVKSFGSPPGLDRGKNDHKLQLQLQANRFSINQQPCKLGTASGFFSFLELESLQRGIQNPERHLRRRFCDNS